MLDARWIEKRRLAALPVSKWVNEQIAGLPRALARSVKREYSHKIGGKHPDEMTGDKLRKTNLWLLDLLARMPAGAVDLAASDHELIEQATRRAAYCQEMKHKGRELAEVNAYCVAKGASIPDGQNDDAVWARACCSIWWRRQLRMRHARAVEAVSIETGRVHKYAGLYCSDDTLSRRTEQRRRNAAMLETMMAVNELGQSFTLAELAAVGMSNHAIRRAELMTRIAGFDLIAKGVGHAGEFYTLTTPSQFHARHHTGQPNSKYDPKNTPIAAQKHLCRVWARIRAKLARDGIRIYGFRVVEPHHDGTPHWHMLLFMQPQHVESVRKVMKAYALKLDGDEPGAEERRFTAKAIDWSKGTAASYLSKYISKNIDGENAHGESIGDDYEAKKGTDAKSAAKRVDAWASCWGIRQFQQIGGAPVTIWRELRRTTGTEASKEERLGRALWRELRGLPPLEGSILDKAAEAADAGRWSEFVRLMGGAMTARKDAPLSLYKVEVEELNRYGETRAAMVKGVSGEDGEIAISRVHEWELQRSGAAASSRSALTRSPVNNCTEQPEKPVLPPPDLSKWLAELSEINTGRPLTKPELADHLFLELIDDVEMDEYPIFAATMRAIIEKDGVQPLLDERMSEATQERELIQGLKTGRRMLSHWHKAGFAGLTKPKQQRSNNDGKQGNQAGTGRRRIGRGQYAECAKAGSELRIGNRDDMQGATGGTGAPERESNGHHPADSGFDAILAGASAWLKGI